MEKIAKVSGYIRLLLIFAMLLQCFFWGYFAFIGENNDSNALRPESAQLNFYAQFEGMESAAKQIVDVGLNPYFWLSTPSAVFHLLFYILLFQLFGRYQQGNIFSSQAALCIKRIGICALAWPVIQTLYPSVLLIGLKLFGLISQGELSIGFGTDKLRVMAAGLMILVIGWVMSEASRLQEEQELTI